jgi:hypothetical protein
MLGLTPPRHVSTLRIPAARSVGRRTPAFPPTERRAADSALTLMFMGRARIAAWSSARVWCARGNAGPTIAALGAPNYLSMASMVCCNAVAGTRNNPE